jgi:hypothetical protein
MTLFARALRGLGIKQSVQRPPVRQATTRPTLEALEDRVVPAAPVTLGHAAQFAVLGLVHTQINDGSSTVNGNEGVSRGGALRTSVRSTITGNVDEFARGEFSGRGHVGGKLLIDRALLTAADADALSAAAQAAALKPTQTLHTVRRATTVVGNGGLNVIDINGDIRASLTLSGGANDVFVVNVTGSLSLSGRAALALTGGVTADHVLYNFTGHRGHVTTGARDAISGTVLAPHYSFDIGGTVNGELIGGGGHINLLRGAVVHQVSFQFPAGAPASLSGTVVDANSGSGMSGVMLTLTGTDDQGHAASLTATTDANGAYSFTGLRPGTYTLTQLPPGGSTETTTPQVGTVNGATDGSAVANNPNAIAGIALNFGNKAINYNFSDMFAGS